jgi:hypothetical protein
MTIDWLSRLRNGLQTTAFCLAIAAMHFAFRPDIAYETALDLLPVHWLDNVASD